VTSITVLEIEGVEGVRDGATEVRAFLNEATVGATVVEGMAYRLDPGGRLDAPAEPGRHQLFYVTAGRPTASYSGEQHQLGPGQGVYCDLGEACALENLTDSPVAFYRFLVRRTPAS
jgi:quercetin dioxygenase-like cupin family protein